jgi:hypothetical protein
LLNTSCIFEGRSYRLKRAPSSGGPGIDEQELGQKMTGCIERARASTATRKISCGQKLGLFQPLPKAWWSRSVAGLLVVANANSRN